MKPGPLRAIVGLPGRSGSKALRGLSEPLGRLDRPVHQASTGVGCGMPRQPMCKTMRSNTAAAATFAPKPETPAIHPRSIQAPGICSRIAEATAEAGRPPVHLGHREPLDRPEPLDQLALLDRKV